jgi:hypothetical protein
MPVWAPKLLLFLLTLGVAVWQQWRPADLAWSMWSASLFGGYLYIITGLTREFLQTRGWQHFLFALPFFTLHFVGFHFGHSQFMQSFFPLSEDELAFPELILFCLREYWPFVVLALTDLFFSIKDKPQTVFTPMEPYKAVIRNHLMIFVVAFAGNLGLEKWLIFALLLLYFFPFELLRKKQAAV